MQIDILPMSFSDLTSLKKNLYEDFDNFWTLSTLESELNNPNSFYFVAKVNDEIVGFAGIWKAIDTMHIMNIVSKITKRNLGIGSKMLEYLIDFSKNQNVTSLTLEVKESNEIAIHLYEKNKFKKIGTRKNYYAENENAIIMTYYF